MTADLSGIRSLLAGIEGEQFDVYPEHPQHIKVFVTDDHRDALAAFIAAAPSTVARLLARLDAALTSVDELMEDYNANVRYADLAKIRAALTGEGA